MMFSIIIPNYNHAKYLKKRIDSVLQQTYKHFEIIILDDSSTDDSSKIIDQYNDSRITYKLYNKENSGSPFKQWKKGLELAKYDYIWIAESDDWANENFLKFAYEALQKNKQISLYYSDSQLVNENELFFSSTIQSYTKDLDEFIWHQNHIFNGRKYVKKYLFHKNFILNASSVIFKKELGLKFINQILNFKTSGDWLFWALLLSEGDVFYQNTKLNYFRYSPQSTRNYNTLEKKQLRIIEKAIVQENIMNVFHFSNKKKTETKHALIEEWAKNHSLKELFSTKYFNLKKNMFFKDINFFKFLSISITYKIHNQWIKKSK